MNSGIGESYIVYKPSQSKEINAMTVQITINDLVDSLRKASASPESHALAQQVYFSELKPNSVLINCGSACCIAGDLILQAHADSEEAQKILINTDETDPCDWVQAALGLSNLEANLAFNPATHYQIHMVLADILGQGLRLPDVDYVALASTYTEFRWARLEDENKDLDLEGLLEWMRSIAR
jgi:hypothetical protein